MENLFKIVGPTTLEPAPASIHTGAVNIENPSVAVYHKFGYWPKEDVEPEKPSEEEGYIVYDDGYKYIDDGNGGKIIKRIYRKLIIVDDGKPEVGENQEFIRDYWEETDTERRHIYVIVDVIDNKPEIDEEKQIIVSDEWVLDEAARTKTHVYRVCTKVDNPPALEEGQQIISDRWEVQGDEYVHIYEVRFIVDNPPELQEGQQVVEDHWDDDGVTRTHVYDKIMFVVDNPPELKEGQQIIEKTFEDDEATNTRTYHYEVRYVVDNPPVLADNEFIVEDHWDDDGTTRTHVYTTHFRVDNPPVLEEGQEIIEDHWDYDEATRTETHVYTVRYVVDNGAPELAENEFIYEDHWDDDGTTRTHVYTVWTKVDQAPVVDDKHRAIATDEWTDDADAKTRSRVYVIKEIVDEKPEDDPDGNFWYEKDGEEETDTQIIIKYKKVYRVWRIFSKLKLEMAVFQLGKMTAFDAFLDSIEMTNDAGETAKIRRFYDQANELAENHKLFKPYYTAALKALNMTEEEGEAILKQCIQETFMVQG